MAFLAALIAFGSRFASKVLTTALGWASTLLFGRVPASRQILLLGITFGSVIWMVMLAGFIFPDLGAFLLLLIPPQNVIPEQTIRLLMLIGVIVVPGVVGLVTLALTSKDERTPRRALEAFARGYPLTILLAVLLVFLALLAIYRKVNSVIRRRTDAHVPMVVKPGAYEQVADDLDRALTDAGFDLTPETAPATMSMPAKWLAAVAGRTSSSLVPDRMLRLRGENLDILIYPMDILISGKGDDVTRARAAMASRLTTSAAHLTVTAEAQAIEDRLTTLAGGSREEGAPAPTFDDAAAAEFASIDEALATIHIPYDEWEVLYRQRLQVERDLRAGAMAGEAVLGAETPGLGGPSEALATVGRVLREGAAALIGAATDDSTVDALDKLAGPRWRVAAQAADVALVAARAAVSQRDADDAGAGAAAGEPARSVRPTLTTMTTTRRDDDSDAANGTTGDGSRGLAGACRAQIGPLSARCAAAMLARVDEDAHIDLIAESGAAWEAAVKAYVRTWGRPGPDGIVTPEEWRASEAERSARSAYEAARDEYRLHLRGDPHTEPDEA